MKSFTSHSAAQTQQFAKQLAQDFLRRGGLITLHGDLGAGKTTFVQGFTEGLGIKERITSPTYVLVRQYNIPSTERWLYHLDLYRLNAVQAASELGIQEMIEGDNIVLVEWPEKLADLEKYPQIKISLTQISENERLIEIIS